jgi:DNA polymerase III subunit gamma/tau
MSYQVIARKWRPQTFEEIVGQKHVTETLQNAIRTGRVAHAYIFSGVRGVGKTTTARVLAKALNCLHGPTPHPCNQCDSCREIAAGSSLDVIEIDAASNRGIDQIRELREMVRYAPASSRNKVVILDEAHQLTAEASNALLKTLEEPPERVIFVLATTQPEDLVETIRSRAQHFHFRSLAFGEIVQALERIAREEGLTAEPGALAVMARAAEGSLRDALSLLEQARVYCGANITDRQVRELLGVVPEEVLDELVAAIDARSAERALKLAHRLIGEGQNAQFFCREAIRHVRNLLVARVAGAASELIAAQAEERPRLAAQAARFSEEDLTRSFQILLATDDDLRRKPDTRLHLELGLLRLVNAARLGSLEELAAELRGAPAGPPPGNPAAAPGNPRNAAEAPPAQPGERRQATPAPSQEEWSGIDPGTVERIRGEVLAQQKFLASLLEHVTRWEAEGDELRLYFPPEGHPLAEMLRAREPMQKLHAIVAQVMGRPVRLCVKLKAGASPGKPGAAESPADLRAQFEKDSTVRAMLERFGGQISNVKVPGGH